MLFALLLAFQAAGAGEVAHIDWRGSPRSYALHVPARAATGPAPLLIALHGSGGSGEGMIAAWRQESDAGGFIVVAPDALHARAWNGVDDGPGFLRKVIDDVAAHHDIDRRRVYLFGHSAGAHFALLMALIESEYFAAAAVHAGAIPEASRGYANAMRRPIPIAIWSGRDDRIVPIEAARATRDFLRLNGVPVRLRELRGEDHRYRPEINAEVWRFLSAVTLPGEPRYARYNDDAADK